MARVLLLVSQSFVRRFVQKLPLKDSDTCFRPLIHVPVVLLCH